MNYPENHRTRHEWDALFRAGSATERHACDHWHYLRCTCLGECDCHWRRRLKPGEAGWREEAR